MYEGTAGVWVFSLMPRFHDAQLNMESSMYHGQDMQPCQMALTCPCPFLLCSWEL